jgi:disulfide bond formation protein DsbB
MTIIKKYSLFLIFAIALIGTLISIYFSDILGWAPCVLCWYQRIFLYPLVIISLVGILRKDPQVHTYIVPIAVIGSLVSLFHNFLYWGILPESAAPCQAGVSCTAEYLKLYGFVTIPLLCLIAFALIIILAFLNKKNYENK